MKERAKEEREWRREVVIWGFGERNDREHPNMGGAQAGEQKRKTEDEKQKVLNYNI